MSHSSERGTKRKREGGDDKHRDESQAYFASKDSVHGTNDKDQDPEGIKASSSKKREKERKDMEKERIFEYICALRNSMGGILLIYFTHMDDSDKSLGLIDELVDDRLNELIEDGALFHDSYSRDWMKGEPNCLSITCNSSSTISTTNYNTHINLNKGFARSTVLNMRGILRKNRPGGEYEKKSLHGLQEASNVQLKSFKGARKVARTDLACHIMNELRLREYISSFAEQNRTTGTYRSKDVSIEGFKLKEQHHEALKLAIRDQVAMKLLFLTRDWAIADRDVIKEFLKIEFNKVDGHRDTYVLEIYVPYFSGVVFFDRDGPESYNIDENNRIQRVHPREWCQKVLEHRAKQIF
ncbi:uncharacterized protein [Haliotis asinina]|uniref:uncharacterized protein n=1 Tax=Haliotis asinina TaxID=109174 RepID=UPI0035326623